MANRKTPKEQRNVPDPLEDGNIPGQHPATPERMPGHTAYYNDRDTDAGNEEIDGGKPAFLYRSDDWLGVTLDSSGQNLPPREGGWTLDKYFTLGVRNAIPVRVSPEQIIRGVQADGFYVWNGADPSRMAATTQ